MKHHSTVGLVTNSSSETFVFSGLGLSADHVEEIIATMWMAFVIDPTNANDLAYWWRYELGHDDLFDTMKGIEHGPAVTFTQIGDLWEHYTSMDNDEVPDKFARFVERSFSSFARPTVAVDRCATCMTLGRNTCPPCPFL